MRHYARGVAFSPRAIPTPRARAACLPDRGRRRAKDLPFGNNKATDLLAIADRVLEGEIAYREGKRDAAFKSSVEPSCSRTVCATTNRRRGSTTRHTLGAALLDAGLAKEAEQVFRTDLDRLRATAGASMDSPAACACRKEPRRRQGLRRLPEGLDRRRLRDHLSMRVSARTLRHSKKARRWFDHRHAARPYPRRMSEHSRLIVTVKPAARPTCDVDRMSRLHTYWLPDPSELGGPPVVVAEAAVANGSPGTQTSELVLASTPKRREMTSTPIDSAASKTSVHRAG